MPESPSHAARKGRGSLPPGSSRSSQTSGSARSSRTSKPPKTASSPGSSGSTGPRDARGTREAADSSGSSRSSQATGGSRGAQSTSAASAAIAAAPGGVRARHGRAPLGENAVDAAARHRLVRLAVLPAGAVAVIAAAAVAYVMRAEGRVDAAGTPSGGTSGGEVWAVLLGGLLLVCAISVAAALAACAEHRRGLERVTELRRATARGEAELRVRLRSLEQGEPLRAGQRRHAPPEPRGDSLDLLGHELAIAQHSAESYVADVVSLMRGNASDTADKVEVFVNLARRLQSLEQREIEMID